mgnify:CR=1 FL=1
MEILKDALELLVVIDSIFYSLKLKMTAPWLRLTFLGSPLTLCMVYIWSKRNPFALMNFLGVLNFSASYLPWVLTLFSYMISGTVPYSDILGITFGHLVWFMEDVAPYYLNNTSLMKAISFGHFSNHNSRRFNVPQ